MHCVHCIKAIPELGNRKFLSDFLSIPSNDIDLGHPEVTVLSALARVAGIRLLITDESISPGKLCICSSCEQLLLNLFVAHERFTNKNSFVKTKKCASTAPTPASKIPVPMFMDVSTQTDFTDNVLIQPTFVQLPQPSSDEGDTTCNFNDDDFINYDYGSPEPFVKIEQSFREVADLKLKESRRHFPDCKPPPEFNPPDPLAVNDSSLDDDSVKSEILEQETNAETINQHQTKTHAVTLKNGESPGSKVYAAKKFHCKFPECAKKAFSYGGLFLQEVKLHGTPKLDPPTRSVQYRERRQRKERIHHCPVDGCGKSFQSPSGLKIHGDTHMPLEQRLHTRRYSRYTCNEPDCRLRFSKKVWLVRHRNIHLPPELRQVVPDKQRNYKCETPGCIKAFRSPKDLENHKNYHLPPDAKIRSYPCQFCDKSFVTSTARSNHKAIHRAADFLCTECGKAFKNKRSYGNHMKIHANERSYECKECGKGFNQYIALRTHMKLMKHTHSEDGSNGGQICEICGKVVKNMTSHMAQHKNQKQYKCPAPSCTAGFNYKHHLRQHLLAAGTHNLRDYDKVTRYLKNPESEKLFG